MAIASRIGRRLSAAPAAGTWASTALVMCLPACLTNWSVRSDAHRTAPGMAGVASLLQCGRIYVYSYAYTTRSSQELRCRRAEQDDLRLRRRPPPLPARPGARRRQPLGGDLRCPSSLRRRRGGPARGLRRDHRPGRARQGPQGPVHRRPPRRMGQHVVQPRRDLPRLPRPEGQVRPPHRAQPRLHRWSTPRASRPAGAAISGSATSATGARPASRPSRSSRTLEELRDKIPPQLYDMVAGSAQQPAVEDLDI